MDMETKKIPLFILIIVVIGALGWIAFSNASFFSFSTNKVISKTPQDKNELSEPAPIFKAVTGAQKALAQKLSVENEQLILITKVTPQEWKNSCLGLEKEDEFCAQVITPGYEIHMQFNEVAYLYRTNADGSLILLDEKN